MVLHVLGLLKGTKHVYKAAVLGNCLIHSHPKHDFITTGLAGLHSRLWALTPPRVLPWRTLRRPRSAERVRPGCRDLHGTSSAGRAEGTRWPSGAGRWGSK